MATIDELLEVCLLEELTEFENGSSDKWCLEPLTNFS